MLPGVNSLFKGDEAGGFQSDLFLGLGATVLDDAQSGVVACKLSRKALHGERVFGSVWCYV